jgi:hypothetical protein
MTIVRFPPPAINLLPDAVAAPPSRPPQAAQAFGAFLAEAASKAGSPPGDGSPLSRAQRLALIAEIRTRMNNCWLGVLGDGEKGASLFPAGGLPGPLAAARGGESSNNQRSNQNNDVSPAPGQLEEIIGAAARANGVDPALVRSVIKAESGFKANSTSPRGAMGLMQLMPGTARELGVRNAYDPVENIWAGTRYLKGLLDRYAGQVDLALAAYNWGMGNLERRPGQLPEETLQYVRKVTDHYQKVRA